MSWIQNDGNELQIQNLTKCSFELVDLDSKHFDEFILEARETTLFVGRCNRRIFTPEGQDTMRTYSLILVKHCFVLQG